MLCFPDQGRQPRRIRQRIPGNWLWHPRRDACRTEQWRVPVRVAVAQSVERKSMDDYPYTYRELEKGRICNMCSIILLHQISIVAPLLWSMECVKPNNKNVMISYYVLAFFPTALTTITTNRYLQAMSMTGHHRYFSLNPLAKAKENGSSLAIRERRSYERQ